jgi:hypothetical protein
MVLMCFLSLTNDRLHQLEEDRTSVRLEMTDAPSEAAPTWVRRMRRSQAVSHGTSAASHAIRSGDHGGGGSSVDLSEGDR